MKSENSEEIKVAKNGLVLEGIVVADKMEKSIVVKVNRMFKHPVVGKFVKRSKKYKAHDEKETAKVGDWVEIAECRPISKTKHMLLTKIIRKSS